MAKRKQKQQSDYDFQDMYVHDFAVVGKNGKFGYINRKGVEITPLKYDRVMRFYEGVGKVQMDGKWGLVNQKGKEIVAPAYDMIVGNNDPIVRLGNKYGFVNRKTGKLLTPVQYDDAEEWTMLSAWSTKYGTLRLALVQLDGKWGCINWLGKEIVRPEYDALKINIYGEPQFMAKLNGKWGFVNEKGKKVTDFEYDEIGYPFNVAYYGSFARVKKDGKYGFIYEDGTIAVPLIYDDCDESFETAYYQGAKNSFYPIWVNRGDRYGFVDIQGKEIAKLKYETVKPFDYRYLKFFKLWAVVVLNGKAGFIDRKGKTVIPCMYEPDFENPNNYKSHWGYVQVKHNGKWGVIDEENSVVIPFLYDEFVNDDTLRREFGFFYAMRNGKKIGIDAKGNEWETEKNPNARTFSDYLHVVDWSDVAESLKSIVRDDKNNEQYFIKLEKQFNDLKNMTFKPSENIMRFRNSYGGSTGIMFYKVKERSKYDISEWNEILDMEVRIEENLSFSDAEIVALAIRLASYDMDSDECKDTYSDNLNEQEINDEDVILKIKN